MSSGSTEWILFFPGGVACYDSPSCTSRWLQPSQQESLIPGVTDGSVGRNANISSFLMTAIGAPSSLLGRTLLSDDPEQNPSFASWNKVYVLYCSSDFWLGSNSAPFQNTSTPWSFSFQGAAIVANVLSDLLFDPLEVLGGASLRNASRVVLVGQSSGAIGVLNHLTAMTDLIRTHHTAPDSADVRVVLDSGWFSDESNAFANTSQGAITTYNITAALYPCLDVSSGLQPSTPSDAPLTGTSCCLLASCLIAHRNETNFNRDGVQVLFVNSLNDAFLQLEGLSRSTSDVAALDAVIDLLNGSSAGGGFNQLPVSTTLNGIAGLLDYGAALNESLRSAVIATQKQPFLHAFLVSCICHTFLVAVDETWHINLGPLQQIGSVVVWNLTAAQNVTIQQAIQRFIVYQPNAGAALLYLVDDSHSNPTCPEAYQALPVASSFPVTTGVTANAWIVGLTAATLVLPFVLFQAMVTAIHCSYRPALQAKWRDDTKQSDIELSLGEPRLSDKTGFVPTRVLLSTSQLCYYPSSKAYKKRRSILRDVSLQPLCSGQLVGVIANSGGGKSTLLELLSCRRRYGCYSGHIMLQGRSTAEDPSLRRWMWNNTAFISQTGGSILSNLTVLENVQHAASIRLPHLSREEQNSRVHSLLAGLRLLAVQSRRTGEDDVAGGLLGLSLLRATTARAISVGASAGDWQWRWSCSQTVQSSSSMNQPPRWTVPPHCASSRCCSRWPSGTGPSSSSAFTRRVPRFCAYSIPFCCWRRAVWCIRAAPAPWWSSL